MTLEGGNAVKGTGLAGAIARARRQAYPEGYVSSKDPLVNIESKAIIEYLIANGSSDKSSVYVVASEAAQLALGAIQGDVAVRTDVSKTYMHNGGISGTMTDWTQFLSAGGGGGGGGIVSVNGDTGPTIELTQDDIPNGSTYVRLTAVKDSNISTAYSHSLSSSNPHSTTASQVGLGNVTNYAQLKRSANDFSSFSNKVTPVSGDVLLIEDSADTGAKKYITVGSLPGGSGGVDTTAIHKTTAAEISALTSKASPIAGDYLLMEDSANSNAKRQTTFGGISHGILANIGTNSHTTIDGHLASTSNPHNTSASQVGLGNVDNTSDANKPMSIATTKQLSYVASTGLIGGGLVTLNTDPSKFDVSAGIGVVVDNYTDVNNPVYTVVTWTNHTGLTTPYLLTEDNTYIHVDSGGNFVLRAFPISNEERRSLITLGWVDHIYHDGTMWSAGTEPTYVVSPSSQLADFLESFGSFNVDGNVYSQAASGLNIQRTEGHTFDSNGNYSTLTNPNVIFSSAANPAEVQYYYRDGDGGWFDDLAPVMSIDPNHWDDNSGTLATVPTGKFTIQAIAFYAQTAVNDLQYGQALYDDLAAAQSALRDSIEIDPYNSYDTFRAWLIIQEGTTDWTNSAKFSFVSAGKLGMVDIASGGGTGGEVNTASNIGSTGVGLYDSKSGVDLRFKNLKASSGKITVINVPGDHTVDLGVSLASSDVGLGNVTNDSQLKRSAGDFNSFTTKATLATNDIVLVEDSADSNNKKKSTVGGIQHSSLGGIGTNSHSTIDSHLGSTSNPHSTSASQVGLGSVTNDSQLKRSASDFSSFSLKSAPVSGDVLLIEDSADTGSKKYITLGTLPAGVDSTAIHKSTSNEIAGLTSKSSPIAGDYLLIEDSANSNVKRQTTFGGISHTILSNIGTNSHSTIDTHLGSTSNPHSTTKAQVGLTNVTDDSQLKRSANDFNSFSLKSSPVSGDILLVEDSEALGVKKYITVGTLPSGGASTIALSALAPSSNVSITAGYGASVPDYYTIMNGYTLTIENGAVFAITG